MPTAKVPENANAPRVGGELRSWAIAIALAVLVLAVQFLLLGRLPTPWNALLVFVPVLAALLAIGVKSKANVWAYLIWLGPLVVFIVAWLVGLRSPITGVGLGLAPMWAAALLVSERLGRAVFGALEGVHTWLTAIGLPAKKRRAYADMRRAWRASPQERQDQLQLTDRPRTVRAFRELTRRIEAVVPPDERWGEVCRASADSVSAYADMLEGKRPLDFDEANALSERGRQLLDEVLRDESPTYRFLNYVPFG